jgi:bla regulator protein BlaR1
MAKGGVVSLEAQSMSLGEFSKFIGGLGRPVVDKTGIAGLFDFHLVYSSDEAPAGLGGGVADSAMPDGSAPPSIFTALKDLGLKLEPARANREFVVIDHVERPSEN